MAVPLCFALCSVLLTYTALETLAQSNTDQRNDAVASQNSRGSKVNVTGNPEIRNQDPQTKLLKHLRQNIARVSPQCYPDLTHGKDPMDVQVTINLIQLMDVNEVDQTMTLNLRFEVKWADCRLTWNTSEYKTEDLEIPPDFPLWYPELNLIQRTDAQRIDWRYDSTIWVTSSGLVSLIHHDILKSGCNIDVLWFPFDSQNCTQTYSNPIYSEDELDILCPDVAEVSEDYSDSYDSGENSEGAKKPTDNIDNDNWRIRAVTRDCNATNVTGKSIPALNFYISMSRKPLYHLFNLLFPCFLLTLLCGLVFLVPPEGGKISLALTILLAIVVFMNMMYGKMPVTAESVPLLSLYFAICLSFVGLSCILAVFVTRLGSYRDAALVPHMPAVLSKFLDKMGPAVLPGISKVYNKRYSLVRKLKAEAGPSCADDCDEENALEYQQLSWYLIALVVDRCCFALYVCFNLAVFFIFMAAGFSRLK